ncbi:MULTISPECIES: GNAT family N-acetyltransferase [unclassified Rhizobium]|uniref:GNAT family N-acetyltransferase n=1 Tax=unclassified Rhizobium TaxID=2613769 RepID=UPI00380D41BE
MAHEIRTVPLAEVPLEDVCQTLNMAYAGYIVPINFDAPALGRRIRAENICLSSSQLLLLEGQGPAGIMLIARRGRVSRIAALGVVPNWRGAGIGRRAVELAIDDAVAHGDDRQILEVIETNDAAISTYTKAGFVPVRRLVGYTHVPAPSGEEIVPCSPGEILPLLERAYPFDASWQTSPHCFVGATAPIEAFRTADGSVAALADGSGGVARLLAFAVEPALRRKGIGRRFIQGLLGRYPDKSWSIPATLPEFQAAAFLTATGWTKSSITQLEMELVPIAS